MAYPYPPSSYPPPPHLYSQQPPYYPPPQPYLAPPAPVMAPPQQPDLYDRNQFRGYYMSGLRALVGNSKPIITDLTILANEFAARHAETVVTLLEEHIRMCDPAVKLPALYLLDSICKNIGSPYTTLFAQRIDRIFLSAFRDVDPPTKIKMEELLGTWRTGGPNGGQLFQGRAQKDIEQVLFGDGLRGGGIGGQGKGVNDNRHFLSGAQQLPSMASKAERQSVLSDVRRLLAIWEMRQNMHPEDDNPREQIAALKQLETILGTATLTSEAVANIRKDINSLTPPDPTPMFTPRPSATPSAPIEPPVGFDFSKLASLMPSRTGSQQTATPPPNDPLALLRGLNLDALKGLSSMTPASSGTDNSEREYEEAILKMDMHLTASDISRYRPSAPELLYERLSLQCKQCAARFLESPSGHAKLQAHHDRHFRQKKRQREATRVQARSWFPNEEDWIAPPRLQPAVPVAESEAATTPTRPLGRVVRPKNPAKVTSVCKICNGEFKSELNEAEEEFYWLDAVEVNGVYYHDSCHSEAMRSRLLAATTTTSKPSREATPVSDQDVSRKRKADEDPATEGEGKRVKEEVQA